MKKFLVLALCLCAALLLLAACGDNETSAETSGSTEATTTSTAQSDLLADFLKQPNLVTLPALSDIHIATGEVNKMVDEYMAKLLDNMTGENFDPVEGAAILGDSVNIYYTGRAKDPSVTLSQQSLNGMTNKSSTTGFDLILGSGEFIPGFEDQLIGAKAGDKVAVDLSFPENFGNDELNGLAVIFDVEVISVSRATVNESAILSLSLTYKLPEGETATEKMKEFIAAKTESCDLADVKAPFDTYFTVGDIKEALIGKNKYGQASVELTLSAENAAELGYDHPIALTAQITLESIVTTPEALTDSLIHKLTSGEYKTLDAFRDYIFSRQKMQCAYDTLIDTATYAELPKELYDALVKDYYDYYTAQMPNLSDKEKEDLAKKAEESAMDEYESRALFQYLAEVTGTTLSDEEYKTLLEDYYRQFAAQNPYAVYYGITSPETLEEYYSRDYFYQQFLNDKTVENVVTQVIFDQP